MTSPASAQLGRTPSSAGFSLRGLVLARTNPRRLKPALLQRSKQLEVRDYFFSAMSMEARVVSQSNFIVQLVPV